MTNVALSLMLLLRDPARQVALLAAVVSLFVTVALPQSPSPLWIVALIAPAFLIGITLAVPAFSAFELAMPVTRANLLWSHILASLTTVWLPVLIGLSAMLAIGRPLANARRPEEFAVFFTACVCLATSARLSPRRAVERTLWLSALLCCLLALRSLPWQAALVITGVAASPLLGKLCWTYWSEWEERRSGSIRPAVGRPIWPLLRMICSLQALAVAPLAYLVGRNPSWTMLPFAAMFLMTLGRSQRYLMALPVSRRGLLLGKLLPVLIPLLAGIPYGYRVGHLNWNMPSIPSSDTSDWRHYSGNPPGVEVPWDYFRRLDGPSPPEIVAPWGETAQARSQKFTQMVGPPLAAYNPYAVWHKNSDGFFEWQFGRATRAIYGKSLRPDELPAAIRAGLKPVTEQPRMEILNMAFAAASLLVIGLLSAMSRCYYSRHLPEFMRSMLKPLGLPLIGMFAVAFFVPSFSANFDPVAARVQPLLFRLSALLPANLIWMTLLLLAALATLYWALETVFNQVEFPDKPKETL
jgi:hypothetical protein